MCSEADLKDLGLPLGHRKKLSNYIKKANEEVAADIYYLNNSFVRKIH